MPCSNSFLPWLALASLLLGYPLSLFSLFFFVVPLHSAVVIREGPDGLTYFVAFECVSTRLLFMDLEF